MSQEIIYDPINTFKNQLKPEHATHVSEFFEKLVATSNVDQQQNKITNDLIRTLTSDKVRTSGRLTTLNFWKVISIIIIVISFIFLPIGIVLIYFGFIESNPADGAQSFRTPGLIFSIMSAILIIFFFIMIFKVINPRRIINTEHFKEVEDSIDLETKNAYEQLKILNSAWSWNTTKDFVVQTMKNITFDQILSQEKLAHIQKVYNLLDNQKNESIIALESGELNFNPFILFKKMIFTMGMKKYTGTKVITWTTYHTDSKGKSYTNHHSETLVATISKPCPFYEFDVKLFYGHQAVDQLHFSRKPNTKANNNGEATLDKFIEKETKKINKLAQKAIKNDYSYNLMNNNEFEVLFNCFDRDDEIHFRELFSPLAQNQMISLLKNRDDQLYGNDYFSFFKENKKNIIKTFGMQEFDFKINPKDFIHYDLELIRSHFNNYNNVYFKHFFLSFTPILSIPIYQEPNLEPFQNETKAFQSLSQWQVEDIVNDLSVEKIQHPDCITTNIVKTSLLESNDVEETHEITASGFRGVDRVEYVTRFGGDGHYHEVPVYWIEYFEVSRTTSICFDKKTIGLERKDFLDKKLSGTFLKGLIFNLNNL